MNRRQWTQFLPSQCLFVTIALITGLFLAHAQKFRKMPIGTGNNSSSKDFWTSTTILTKHFTAGLLGYYFAIVTEFFSVRRVNNDCNGKLPRDAQTTRDLPWFILWTRMAAPREVRINIGRHKKASIILVNWFE